MIDMTDILQNEKPFRYMMLSRMKSDCDYYLGYGNRYAKHLWAGDEREQIDCMKALWNSFSAKDKPEWLTWDQILDYEQQMCPAKLPLNQQISDAAGRATATPERPSSPTQIVEH